MNNELKKTLWATADKLRSNIDGEIKSRFATNIVQIKKYSELLEKALNRYRNRGVETAQVIEELIALAKEVNGAVKRGENAWWSASTAVSPTSSEAPASAPPPPSAITKGSTTDRYRNAHWATSAPSKHSRHGRKKSLNDSNARYTLMGLDIMSAAYDSYL